MHELADENLSKAIPERAHEAPSNPNHDWRSDPNDPRYQLKQMWDRSCGEPIRSCPKLEASHSAVRALSVSAYNRGCMWHVSAPHQPCIGHRTGYSLHENARISGLASADFEGVFAHSYKRCRPGFFLRALRKE